MKFVELFMGYNFAFRLKVQIGLYLDQVGAHRTRTIALHVLDELPTRPPCARARPTIATTCPYLSMLMGSC